MPPRVAPSARACLCMFVSGQSLSRLVSRSLETDGMIAVSEKVVVFARESKRSQGGGVFRAKITFQGAFKNIADHSRKLLVGFQQGVI